MNTATHVISVFVGIDVSKNKLDCAFLLNGKIKSKVVSNDRHGFALLNAWLQERNAVLDAQVRGQAFTLYLRFNLASGL